MTATVNLNAKAVDNATANATVNLNTKAADNATANATVNLNAKAVDNATVNATVRWTRCEPSTLLSKKPSFIWMPTPIVKRRFNITMPYWNSETYFLPPMRSNAVP